jgi:hypothetical protein
MINGRCNCGKVQYEVTGELVDFCHCHCSICRKLHGAAFVSWGGVARDEFSLTCAEGDLKTYAFSDQADSIFCSHCGSRMWVDFKPEPDMMYITLGTVDGEVDCPPGFHQFVGSKAPWFEITDDLPQHKDWPDEE